MVVKEQKQLSDEDVRQLVMGGEIRRAPSGGWTLEIWLDGEVVIDKERSLPIVGSLRIKSRQRGRKGNPAQNWGKGRFQSKEKASGKD